ncbi:right-handed parallel beta-helix repeat-containing protein [Halomarina pelagica]|uniref:right-handed parallel beta-helix repeat-containing protein n=1 Tax=Halomarina pelagica TaxID=2961599 RepID=UPI0020C2AF1F|nr:right-handed parallel beta-helix repeat-containing protein [Halomarina sp. BND7]
MTGNHPGTDQLTDEKKGSEGSGPRLDRRSYLRMGAATTASLGLLGSAVPASAEGATRHGIEFDRVLNAVEDLGMDPNGNEPIDDALAGAIQSGTLIEFPPGEYLATREQEHFQLDDFGIRGTGGSRRDTQFVFPEGYNELFLTIRWGRGHLYENFTLQQYEDGETAVGLYLAPNDNLQFHDVEIAGYNARSGQRGLAPYIYDEDGTGVIDGYVRRGGGAVGRYPSGTQALFVGHKHRGTLYIRNSHVEEAGENGIYASRCQGDIRIEDCYFKNNDIASVRIAGEGSYVRGSTFVVDTDTADNDPEAFDNVRALWWESGDYAKEGGYVENCEFVLESADVSGGLLRVSGTAGAMTVRNCRFRNETRHANIFARAPSSEIDDAAITVEGVSITGGDDDPHRGGIEIVGRSGSSVTDSCISLDGGYDGVVVRHASGCTVKDSTIDVPGETVVEDDAGVATSNIDESGSCPLPDPDGGASSGGSSDDGSSSDGGSDSSASQSADTDEGSEAGEGGEPTGDGSTGSNETTGSDDGDGSSGESDDGNATDGGSSDGSSGSDDASSDGAATGGDVEVETASTDGSSDGSSGGSSDGSSGGGDGGDGATASGATPQSLPNVLSIRSDAVSPYRVVVDGAIELDPDFGTEDVVSGNTARGVLAGGWDVYRFSGEIAEFDIDGQAEVSVNGTFVDPDELGTDGGEKTESSDDLPNTISIKGDPGELLPYHVEVSGDIAFDPDFGTEDRVADGAAEGVIAGGWDVYRYSGEIVEFDVRGDADLKVNGEPVDEESV